MRIVDLYAGNRNHAHEFSTQIPIDQIYNRQNAVRLGQRDAQKSTQVPIPNRIPRRLRIWSAFEPPIELRHGIFLAFL